MRVLTVIGLLLAGGIRSLSAQHGGQVEIGWFGSYTRYDSGFRLDNQFGSGARLGYFLGDHFSLEVDGNVAQPLSRFSGVGKTNAVFGSASLVVSSGSAYVLGGYSRLHMGPNAPYSSDLNALHGGLGERIFFVGDRVALRVEARAYYRGPGGAQTSPHWVGHFTGMAGLSFLLGASGAKQAH
jgi:OprF membrane domain